MKLKKWFTLDLCMLLLVSFVCGCHNQNNEIISPKAVKDEISLLIDDGWTEADATERLVYLRNEKCHSLDAYSDFGHLISRVMYYCIYDTLLTYDEDGNLCPWLAESYELSDDLMSATFHLRDNVWFTNGQKLTADDAVFTFVRLRDDDTLTDTDTRDWRPYLGEIEKLDDLSFSIHFLQPMPIFFEEITSPELAIICKNAYETLGHDAYFAAPPGTGAYVVSSWDSENTVLELTLRTDEHGYWGYRYTGVGTNVKEIVIAYSSESQDRLSALRSGEATVISDIRVDDISIIASEGLVVQQLPATTMTLFAFNYLGAFGNQDLREAVSLAINRELLLNTFFNGFGEPAAWFCRKGDVGWDSYQEELRLQYDPARASELVKSSGYRGEKLKLIYNPNSYGQPDEFVLAIQAMLDEVGINLEIYTLEDTAFLEQCQTGSYDLCLTPCLIKGKTMYETETIFDGLDWLQTNCTNSEIKELCLSLPGTGDPELYEEIFNQIYQLKAIEFGPTLPLLYVGSADGMSPTLSGILYHDTSIPDFHACRISEN